MAKVKNVQLQVLNNKVRVTGRLEFTQNEIGDKYSVKILLFGDDTGESAGSLGPLYTFRFGEKQFQPVGSPPQAFALSKTITAAPIVNIDETDRLDQSRLNEDPGGHRDEVAGQKVWVPNQDEVFAVISLFDGDNPDTAIETGKSEIVSGVFA